MVNNKYTCREDMVKGGAFVNLTPYGTLGVDRLSPSGTTTSAGAESRAVAAAEGTSGMAAGAGDGAPRPDHGATMAHLFSPVADTIDLSSLSLSRHPGPSWPQPADSSRPWPGLDHSGAIATGHVDGSPGLVDHLGLPAVHDLRHQDADVFTEHLGHHVHHEFG